MSEIIWDERNPGREITTKYKLDGMREKSREKDQSKIELGGMRDKSHKRDNK